MIFKFVNLYAVEKFWNLNNKGYEKFEHEAVEILFHL